MKWNCGSAAAGAAERSSFYLRLQQIRGSSCPRMFEDILKSGKIYTGAGDFDISFEMAGKMKVAHDCSYKTYSVCESAADSSSSRVEEDAESDGPAVFMCGKCKLPIGDSLYWAGSDDEHNQIMLKRKILCFYGSSL